jgi:hypothetical protein
MINRLLCDWVALLKLQDDPRRQALALVLDDVAQALDAISLVDMDTAPEGSEHAAVDKVLDAKPMLTVDQTLHLLNALDRLNAMLPSVEAERMAPTLHQIVENMGGLILSLSLRVLHLSGNPPAVAEAWCERKKGTDENSSSS